GQYYPQNQDPYPPQYGYPQGQPAPQVVYVQQPAPQRDDWWLTSLLALCCGCLVGEMHKNVDGNSPVSSLGSTYVRYAATLRPSSFPSLLLLQHFSLASLESRVLAKFTGKGFEAEYQ
ncbi:unnamed protein product, partial [Heligmosomoides polygyrus]|uniref:CYSTM domain-containing protein n=1 Tax=Heligmosomoides polygyrus TaxID=6339 RepID=A0A183GDK2_HELPZ